ncbi:MAG TPA: hypothetical protein VEL74_07370 [Thermoanaerobaculia bacterium]|nr:hypothetical protein [Thermoanaerobaculia bacterium]
MRPSIKRLLFAGAITLTLFVPRPAQAYVICNHYDCMSVCTFYDDQDNVLRKSFIPTQCSM